MNLRKYYSPTSKILLAQLPDWMEAKFNALSIASRLVNPLAITIDKILEIFQNMYNQWNLVTANQFELYESFIVEDEDVRDLSSTYDDAATALSTAENLQAAFALYEPIDLAEIEASGYTSTWYDPYGSGTFSTVTDANGSGYANTGTYGAIDLVKLDDDDEYNFYKYAPTSFISSLIYEGPEEDDYHNCQYNNGILYINKSEPGVEKRIRFSRYIDSINETDEVSLTSEGYAVNYTMGYTESIGPINRYTNHFTEYQVIVDDMVVFKKGDTDAIQPSGIVIPSGYYFVGSGYSDAENRLVDTDYYSLYRPWEWANELYRSDYDFDDDGIIDDVEVELMRANMGRSIWDADMDDDIWKDRYSRFDLNNDGQITQEDMSILEDHIFTTANPDTNIICFKEAGEYYIRYSRSEGGGISGYTVKDNAVYPWLNDSFNESIQISHEEGLVDVAYDELLDTFYFTDYKQRAVFAMKFSESGSLVDTYKIPIPVQGFDSELRGVTMGREGYVYVVANDDTYAQTYLYSIDTRGDAVRDSVTAMPIYQKIPGLDLFMINSDEMPVGGYGITNFKGDSLIMTAGNKIYLLEPRYDIAMYSTETNRLHLRSRTEMVVDDIDTPSFKMYPWWNNIWNEFDEWAFKVGLTRLPGENNIDLKIRIDDVYIHYPHANEQGYINGVTRDLGIDRYDKDITSLLYVLSETPVDIEANPPEVKISVADTYPVSISTVTTEAITNDAGIFIYNKYYAYAENLTTGTEDLIYTIDGNIIELFLIPNPSLVDNIGVKYQYEDDDGVQKTIEQTFEVEPRTAAGDDKIEFIRVSDLDRMSNPDYGFYTTDVEPTTKLITLAQKLRTIDNTTWNNLVMDVSRFDTDSVYHSGDNSIPSFWQ